METLIWGASFLIIGLILLGNKDGDAQFIGVILLLIGLFGNWNGKPRRG